MPAIDLKSLATFLTLLAGVVGATLPASALAYDAPWDQGHQTTDDDDPEPPPPPGPCGNNQGSPVYVATGDLVWHETDIRIPGRIPLTLSRSYNSADPRDGLFGKGWSANCAPTLLKIEGAITADQSTDPEVIGKPGAYVLREGNGRRQFYTWSDDHSTIDPPKWGFDKVEPQADGTVKLIKLDGGYRLFDAQGRLLKKVDRNGNALTYTRDSEGKLTRQSDGAGQYLDYTYDSTGHVSRVTDHAGRSWLYAYDVEGALISVTAPLNDERQYRYQAYETVDYGENYSQNPATTPAGATTPPAGEVSNYQQLTQVSDASGVVELAVTYEGRRVKTYTEGANTYTYTYPSATASVTNTLTKRDTMGSQWTYAYDPVNSLIVEKTDPANHTESWSYDDHSRIKSYTDKEGHTWEHTHDALGRRTHSKDPLGQETRWEYLGNHPWPVKITSPGGRVTTLAYDVNGNLTQITDAGGAVSKLEYNAQGDLTAQIDPAGNRTEIRYNSAGQPSQYKDPLGRVTRLAYDDLGRLISTTNPAGETERIAYDSQDRITLQTDALEQSTAFAYDAAGRLLKVTDARGNDIGVYTYDEYGRKATATEAGIQYRYGYNTDNTLASRVQGDVTTTYQYDERRLPIGLSTADVRIQMAYDRDGRPISQSGNAAGISYQYDAAGQITEMTQSGNTFTLTRNQEGELTGYTLGGQTYRLDYDQRGQLARLTTPAGAYELSHDPRGLLSEIQLPNGNPLKYEYDPAGQLAGQDYSASGGINYQYSYDTASRLITASGDSNRQYDYDAASRLIGATHDGSRFAYQYDPAGNRTENGQSLDTANRLVEDTEHTYEYDSRGNLAKKSHKTSGAHTDYRYNGLNQLIELKHYPDATATTPSILATYQYDAMGRRVGKAVNDQMTAFQWLGSQLITETRPDGITYTYSYAEGYAPVEVSDGTHTYHVHSDHLDTPRYLTNQSGTIVWTNVPSPYGISQVDEDPDGDGNKITFNIRFPGQYFDEESGSFYNYFRDYDPATGRYLQSDPIGLRGGLNTYAYVGGNPLAYFDSLGLSQQDVNNAWGWMQNNYPDLTNNVTFGSSALVGYIGASGIYIPGANHFYLDDSFYDECLTDEEKWKLRNTMIHELLHIYLENQIGPFNYFWNDSDYGYHDWVYQTTDNVQNYWENGWYWNPSPPPPQTYDSPPINNYPRQPR